MRSDMGTLDETNDQDLTADSEATAVNVTSGAVSGLEHRSIGGGDPDQQGPANKHGDTEADHQADLESTGHVYSADSYRTVEQTDQTPDAQAALDAGSGSSGDVDGTVDEVLASVGDNTEAAQAALDAERAKPEDQQRSTLIAGLQAKGAQ